jgi:trigger factor
MTKPPAVEVNDLQVEAQEISACYRKVTVTVPFSRIAKDLEQACQRLAFTHKVPGFRKGKPPLSVIKRKLGKEAVHDEMYKSILPGLLHEGLAKTDIKAVALATCEIISFEENQPLKFEAVVPTSPKVELGNYEGIQLWEPLIEATDEEVDEEIMILRKKEAPGEEKEGPAETGDIAWVDLEVKMNGKRRREKCFTNYCVELRLPSAEPELVENLIGAKPGEDRLFAVDVPGENSEAQTLSCRAKLKRLGTLRLPEVDEGFLAKQGCATIEELRAKLKKELIDRKERIRDEYLTDQVLEKVVLKSQFDIPGELIDMWASYHYEQAEEEIRRQHQKSLDEHLKITGVSEEDFQRQVVERTHRTLKQELVLLEIAKQRNLEPSTEEIAGYATEIGLLPPQLFGNDVKAVVGKLRALDSYERCRRALKKEKALDWLVSRVKFHRPPIRKNSGRANGPSRIKECR